MVLLVDIGNTRVKWCLAEKGELGQRHCLIHHGELSRLFDDPAWRATARPERVVLSSVLAMEQTVCLSSWIETQWGCAAQFVEPARRACGVTNGYTEARRLGADRWAALIGARHTVAGAVCLFDCGTALTMDMLDADGLHHGGLIMPGLRMMRDALTRQSDALYFAVDEMLEEGVLPPLATDTPSAVIRGTLHTMVAVMERIVKRMEMEQEITVLVTGGDAEVLLPWMERPCQHRPDLVLQGLAVIGGGGA